MSASRPLTASELAAERTGRTRRRRRRRSLVVVLFAVLVAVTVLAWKTRPPAGSTADGVQLDPSAFSPTACMAFAPTAGDRHTTVFLDAGHGGSTPGRWAPPRRGPPSTRPPRRCPSSSTPPSCCGPTATGWWCRGPPTRAWCASRPPTCPTGMLSLQGAHDDVAARDVCANLAGASVLVGIYFDSGGSPSDAGSVTTYDTARPFSADNLRLATLVQKDVLAAMNARGWQIPDDGVQPDSEEGSLVQTSSDSPLAEAAAALRARPAAGSGRPRLLHHPVGHARGAHRAAVRHRPLRRHPGRQPRPPRRSWPGDWPRPSSSTSGSSRSP